MSYQLPVNHRTDEDDMRLVHADVPRMSSLRLWHEWCRVIAAAADTEAPNKEALDWLYARFMAIRAEQRSRAPTDGNARRATAGAAPHKGTDEDHDGS
jgi:hypothetical protein